jgi:hypothetical protein
MSSSSSSFLEDFFTSFSSAFFEVVLVAVFFSLSDFTAMAIKKFQPQNFNTN